MRRSPSCPVFEATDSSASGDTTRREEKKKMSTWKTKDGCHPLCHPAGPQPPPSSGKQAKLWKVVGKEAWTRSGFLRSVHTWSPQSIVRGGETPATPSSCPLPPRHLAAWQPLLTDPHTLQVTGSKTSRPNGPRCPGKGRGKRDLSSPLSFVFPAPSLQKGPNSPADRYHERH